MGAVISLRFNDPTHLILNCKTYKNVLTLALLWEAVEMFSSCVGASWFTSEVLKHKAEKVDIGALLSVRCFLHNQASTCTVPETAKCLLHSNEGFLSHNQDFIGARWVNSARLFSGEPQLLCQPKKIEPEIYSAISWKVRIHLALQSGSRISVSLDFTLTLNAVWSEQEPWLRKRP